MLEVAVYSGCTLALTNVALKSYVWRNPASRLAADMDDGCNRQVHHYVVPILTMMLGLALLSLEFVLEGVWTEWHRIDGDSWWFGVRRQWATSWALGLGAGHYVQDMITNKWCGTVLFAHHVAAVAHAFALQAASSWGNMLFCWSGVYEAGSLLLNLGYTGAISRKSGHYAQTVSSIVGICFGIHGIIVQWPRLCELNAAAWFSVLMLFLLGIGRIQDGVENLIALRASESRAKTA
mmetsp:Transcript_14787/g.44433  ORF Transcript_14787/g.44433 Transcript_14787/m.44433 type:complete len:236 (+) Transcript_14787:108-815(+)